MRKKSTDCKIMHPIVFIVSIIIFFIIGIHHWFKHKELTGFSRFMQYKDLAECIWSILKSHEGIQVVVFIFAVIFLFT